MQLQLMMPFIMWCANWCSRISKHALQQLTRIFHAEPFKNLKNQRKEYITNQLKDVNYTYHDPKTRVCLFVAHKNNNNQFYVLDWGISLLGNH